MAGVLGAIIAGGAARRFGSDKARAIINGRMMMDHVAAALQPQVDMVVVCGRIWPGLSSLADLPAGRIGPLAGLNAALKNAEKHRFSAVICVPVDTLPLPANLVSRLAGSGAAVFDIQHSIGYWPTALAPLLDAHIRSGGRSWRGWIAHASARIVAEPAGIANINFSTQLPGMPS